MPAKLPTNSDIRRRLKERLLALSPRAFEFFAGDLLTYIGLQNVAVTRYIGDGGIDAQGDLIAESGFVCVPTGVQVKRYRQNVRRPDIDRFIGALGGQFSHGIFITTAGYASQALTKASTSPLLRVDTVDGNQVIDLMLRHSLGILNAPAGHQIEEDYFRALEARVISQQPRIGESSETYEVATTELDSLTVRPEDDLISLRSLSYLLRVDTTTIRDWIERDKLQPDRHANATIREGFFFRRDRVESIRRELVGKAPPTTGSEWRQEFLDFARSRNLTKSYKPVLLKALFRLVDRNGVARLDDLAREFHAFYLARQRNGLPTEGDGPMKDPAAVSVEMVKKLIVKMPLDRFLIQHFLEYDQDVGIVRFTPQLWEELRFYELLDLQASADEQLRYYYERR